MVQLFPHFQVPKKKKEIPLGFVPIASSQKSRREKGVLQFPRPSPKRAPLKPEKERKRSAGNVLGLLVSMTKWFCLLKLVCCFFNFKGEPRQFARKYPLKRA